MCPPMTYLKQIKMATLPALRPMTTASLLWEQMGKSDGIFSSRHQQWMKKKKEDKSYQTSASSGLRVPIIN